MCICVRDLIKVGRLFIEIWRFYDLQWRTSAISNFSKFRVYVNMSCDLYRHGILLPCANLTEIEQFAVELCPKNNFKNGGRLPSRILKIFISGHMAVTQLQICICASNFIKIFRWHMAISRFSRWQISAILNFMGPIMGCLESAHGISHKSSIETIAVNCLLFEKNRVFCGDRQTNR